ncbi:MAG: hypothetical protein PVG74_19245, partial [Desulfobacterales bacterium]
LATIFYLVMAFRVFFSKPKRAGAIRFNTKDATMAAAETIAADIDDCILNGLIRYKNGGKGGM